MEPNDLNSPPPDDAQLEAWLRTNASQPPLPDDGFTSRVVATLPPPRFGSNRRLFFCLAGALLGFGVAAFQFLRAGDLPTLDAALLHSLEQLSQPAVGIALGVTLVSLGYVFWSDLRRLVAL